MKKLFKELGFRWRIFKLVVLTRDMWQQPQVKSARVRVQGFDEGRRLRLMTPEAQRNNMAYFVQGTALNPHKQNSQDQYDWYIGFAQGAEFQPYCHMPFTEWRQNERKFRAEQLARNAEIFRQLRQRTPK